MTFQLMRTSIIYYCGICVVKFVGILFYSRHYQRSYRAEGQDQRSYRQRRRLQFFLPRARARDESPPQAKNVFGPKQTVPKY